jgi:hypothetical protein
MARSWWAGSRVGASALLVAAMASTPFGGAACGTLIGLGDLERTGDVADASVTGDRALPPDAALGDESLGPQDSAADARADSSADAPVEARTGGILCGASACANDGTAVCCLGATPACAAPDAGCSGKVAACDDLADCEARGLTGTICCAPANQQGGIVDVRCASGAGCDPQQQGFDTLCDPGVGCAGGRSCVSITSGQLAGYYRCR